MDSIIFDLDGTIWDSRKTVLLAWNKVIRNNKLIEKELTEEDFRRTMGLQIKEIGKILFPQLTIEQQGELLQACCSIECEYLKQYGGRLYENVENTLKALSEKYRLYIVSNCQKGYIEAFYEYHQLSNYFLDFENPGRTGLSKGENIRLVIERNHLTDPVYVGDTKGDLVAAKHAGIPFVYAGYGFGELKADCCDYQIASFKQLLDLF